MTTASPSTTGPAALAGPAAAGEATPTGRGGSAGRRRRVREAVTAYAFTAPAVLLFAAFGLYSLGYGLALSGATWNGFSPHWTWVGLDNYLDLLYRDPVYAPIVRSAAWHTLAVMIAVPLLVVAISFPLAVLLNSARRLRTLMRTVYFLPFVTSGIAVYLAWQYVLQPNGAVNALLRACGLGTLAQPQGFLGNPDTALPTVIVVMVWTAVPVGTLLYLTGLQSLDPCMLEAAALDGAGWWRTNRSVVWPLLRPITAATVLLNLREALQGFQTFLVMTGGEGAPGGHTDVLGLASYRLAFLEQLQPTLGLASALGWLLFAVAVLLALLNLRALRSTA
ncbi:carbohydrate ABC transporter permease [Actinomadura parmotrematis]|uniref:Sugar ABC transporter permease n=1 Tax=Actinomadura parmotrematis TaxID=2864039 RepID=A0ABS7G2M3_9ACTN|nr:sugar ABC transporter permease [Actinomadura parmotrematis]MBW8486731.1 sugar ABC transporter permease [Actinomadura parmotrematis]